MLALRSRYVPPRRRLQPRHLAFERLVATQPNLHLGKENNQQLLVAYLVIRSSFQPLGKWIGDEVKLTRKSLRQPLCLSKMFNSSRVMANQSILGRRLLVREPNHPTFISDRQRPAIRALPE